MSQNNALDRMTKKFLKVLFEDQDHCPTTTRIDGTGRRVKLQCGDKFAQGSNQIGVVIKPGHSAKEDETGQMVSVGPCQHLKAGKNKKAIAVCSGEPTEETNGQIRKRTHKSNNRLTFEEMFQRVLEIASEGQ